MYTQVRLILAYCLQQVNNGECEVHVVLNPIADDLVTEPTAVHLLLVSDDLPSKSKLHSYGDAEWG